MSQYAQVQTYASCTHETFPEVLACYREALIQLGCKDTVVLDWLETIRWPSSDDDSFGDIYASPITLTPPHAQEIVCDGLEVSLYTHSAIPSIEDLPSWVGFNLLFDTEVLKEDQTAPYTPSIGNCVWQMLQTLIEHFPQIGAYFTDEWQENHAWRAIVEDEGDPWVFELGIFPRTLAEYFELVPAGFKGTVIEKGFGFAQENRWQQLPWLSSSKG